MCLKSVLNWKARPGICLILLLALPYGATGCQSAGRTSAQVRDVPSHQIATTDGDVAHGDLIPKAKQLIELAGHTDQPTTSSDSNLVIHSDESNAIAVSNELAILESIAATSNRELQRLNQETAAAWAKVRYIDKLPDPMIGANVFGHPIETAAGSQRANLTVSQMIPWLDRLDAQAQQACFEAMAMQQAYQAERLRVIGALRANWAKLYVLGRQLETVKANQQLLKSLGDLVTARLAQNRGSVGDVTLLTVEQGRLEEQLLTTSQQIQSTRAEMNRLIGRSAETPIGIPRALPTELPQWSHDTLRQWAWEKQPAIAAAQLRASASRWGIEVAELRRRPDISVGASWFLIDDNRPTSAIVDVGQDAWSLGAQVSVPLWVEKYDAMQDEATWKHFAAQSSVQDVRLKYDAALRDLWEQAKAAHETASLYRSTIIPQARQTLDADQQALANGTVDLDRVIQDIRNLLMLELGYDRALGQLAVSLARIRESVGVDLQTTTRDDSLLVPQIPDAPDKL